MKIVLSGVETNNKGAELMLYAILQEIERKFPDAIVYAPSNGPMTRDLSSIKTNLDFREHPAYKNFEILKKLHMVLVSKKLKLFDKLCNKFNPIKNVDYFLDASGYHFLDNSQWTLQCSEYWQKTMEGYKKQKTKIVFLPQAFGPLTQTPIKNLFNLINENADKIYVRDKISWEYIKEARYNMTKMEKYPDFTSLVEGVFPSKYNHLKNGICIIPNTKIIAWNIMSQEKYVQLLTNVIEKNQNKNYPIYLLNHEGEKDYKLALEIQKQIGIDKLEIVNGLNALEIKGLISTAYICISSRFHGVASALNSCVPCVSTGWSHKYQELYDDYKQENCMLPTDNLKECINIIENFLNTENNKKRRTILKDQIQIMRKKTIEMWDKIWNC